MIVTGFDKNIIFAKRLEDIINFGSKAETHFIPRINNTTSNNRLPWDWHRKQFPVRLAYASLNKAQGQSLSWEYLDRVFSY